MAKTAVINKETKDLIGIAQSDGTAKLVYEGAGLTVEQVELVTAKTFQPSDRYPTFKDMTLTEAERAEAAKKAEEKAEADAKKAEDKEAKAKERAEKAANRPAPQPRGDSLTGPYHLIKPFPATRLDHPKMPIWEAIAKNNTVEEAKAACPEKNPARMTNGSYTFASEFRYFLRTGYIAMGVYTEPEAEKESAGEAAPEATAA